MSTEPATRHFSPAQLAEFLDELSADVTDRPLLQADGARAAKMEPPTRLARPRRVPGASRSDFNSAVPMPEPATVLGGGHVISIGAPRWRARGQSSSIGTPHFEVRSSRDTRHAASAEREIVRLTHTRPWRLAFIVVALLSAGLLGALALRPAPVRQVANRGRPPPLPAPPAASVSSDEAVRVSATARPADSHDRERTDAASARISLAPAAAVQTPDGSTRPVVDVAPVPRVTSLAALTPGPSTPGRAARRDAVDTLLAGRTRAALAAYRALYVSTPSPALGHVVRLLERELQSCASLPEGACGT